MWSNGFNGRLRTLLTSVCSNGKLASCVPGKIPLVVAKPVSLFSFISFLTYQSSQSVYFIGYLYQRKRKMPNIRSCSPSQAKVALKSRSYAPKSHQDCKVLSSLSRSNAKLVHFCQRYLPFRFANPLGSGFLELPGRRRKVQGC